MSEDILEMGTDELWDAYSAAKKSHDYKRVDEIEAEMRARFMID